MPSYATQKTTIPLVPPTQNVLLLMESNTLFLYLFVLTSRFFFIIHMCMTKKTTCVTSRLPRHLGTAIQVQSAQHEACFAKQASCCVVICNRDRMEVSREVFPKFGNNNYIPQYRRAPFPDGINCSYGSSMNIYIYI